MTVNDPFDAEQAAFELADATAGEALGLTLALGETLRPWVVRNAAAGSHALTEIVGYLIKAYVVDAGFEKPEPIDPVVGAGGSVEPF
jgi:hypothetical protein